MLVCLIQLVLSVHVKLFSCRWLNTSDCDWEWLCVTKCHVTLASVCVWPACLWPSMTICTCACVIVCESLSVAVWLVCVCVCVSMCRLDYKCLNLCDITGWLVSWLCAQLYQEPCLWCKYSSECYVWATVFLSIHLTVLVCVKWKLYADFSMCEVLCLSTWSYNCMWPHTCLCDLCVFMQRTVFLCNGVTWYNWV